ncbi:MAG: hypothetical protein Q8N02_05145 [Methylotenera sp.]|nr:hypothetical protein [Methylotenera sp.]MDO9232948.1 hypothetical protein [Methylotenera sp.]MDO9387962.1 hypothetical protein [Methylotenera sp.]MDP2102256.1 hypothetical protein [Methylotenera sp.]MDP2281216.1 hypothetical protein [Methylotenera sp.]
MNEMREKEAINAYLKLLQAKGATSAVLHRRALFLDKLSSGLAGKTLDGGEYRLVIEEVMETIPADDWHENLTAAREFYLFWVKDIKAIAALNINPGFDIHPSRWKPGYASLKSLTDSLETEKFDTSENWPLKAYTQALRHEGAEQVTVDTRVKLAKVILIRLRNAPEKNHKAYRIAVDLTLPLFNIKQNRRLFLVVVREFYHFWSGNPDAANMVLKDGSGNILL